MKLSTISLSVPPLNELYVIEYVCFRQYRYLKSLLS